MKKQSIGNGIYGECKQDETAYALINTTNYNNDNKWAIMVCSLSALNLYGFDENEIERIKDLQVGERATFEYGLDAQVIRLA